MQDASNEDAAPKAPLLYVEGAVKQARQDDDLTLIFATSVIACATFLLINDPGNFHNQVEVIKKWFGSTVAKDWSGRVRAEVERQKREDKELANSAKKMMTDHGDLDLETPLPDTTAHAYGLNVYAVDPSRQNKVMLFRLMNREYALVPVAGKSRYMSAGPKGEIWFSTSEDVAAVFRNVIVEGTNAFAAWCAWPHRATFKGVGFFPGSPVKPSMVPPLYANTWKGFRVEAKGGSWKLLDAHFRKVICGDKTEYAEFLYDWFAQLIQEPQTKAGSAVVLKSKAEGSGKSLLINNVLKPIFGDAATTIDKSAMLTSHFNSFLEHTVVVGIEEAIWAGSKPDAGIVKNLVTSPTIRVERKGLDSYDAPNYTRLIFTSNEDWVVPAGPLARRYFVLDVKNARANNPAYFKPLFKELESGGVEAFLFDMLKRKITHDLNQPPYTDALAEQRELSLGPVERWALQVARSGFVEWLEADRTTIRKEVNAGLRVPCDELRAAVGRGLTSHQLERLDHQLGKLLTSDGDGLGCKRVRAARGYTYEFPTLSEFRTKCAKRFSIPIEGFDGQHHEAGSGKKRFNWRASIDKYMAMVNALPDTGN